MSRVTLPTLVSGPEYPYNPQPPPSKHVMPAQGWFSPKSSAPPFAGTADGNTNIGAVSRWTQWSSPVFDLRPEFEGTPASSASPQQQGQGQQPIWKPSGLFGRLWIEFTITSGSDISGLNITYTAIGHPFDPFDLRVICPEQDVTQALLCTNTPRRINEGVAVNGPQGQAVTSGELVLTPPGGISPIRFWQVLLMIRNWKVTSDPKILISAGYY